MVRFYPWLLPHLKGNSMKFQRFLFLLIIVMFIACRNEAEQDAEQGDSANIVTETPQEVKAVPYNVEFDEKTQALSIVKSSASVEDASAAEIISALNRKHTGIKLDLVNAGNDTIFVKIDDANNLTQGMGSTGAESYLAELTFSLTELKGIKAVDVDFKEGDHAMPGVYTRNDFKDLLAPKEK